MLPLDVLAGQFAMATGLMGGSFELPYHPLLVALYIFLLASYVGFYVISKVPPTLHTPLMSGSNAISGITIVGSLEQASQGNMTTSTILGMLAILFAVINVVGGYGVTDRMLQMFAKKK
jgi:H+-translocating NAD(P) transhydrogenase subunit alpha